MATALRQLAGWLSPRPLEPLQIAFGNHQLDVIFRRHASAKRLVLRLNSDGTAAIVTVPRGISRPRAFDFVKRSTAWLECRLEQHGSMIVLRPGSCIPLRGAEHEIRHVDLRRGVVTVDPAARAIQVPGELPHVARRLLDWLKAAARAELSAASAKYAELMQVSYRRISIKDQRSRWGSCSADGSLSYSWRLILTPPYVLDYVAAHEVAHLRHLDHGASFWRLVLSHCPEASRAKKWLKANGQSVHRITA